MSGPSEVEKVANLGLTVLWQPASNEQTFVDIVFVHGLQGHPRNTWTWEADASIPSTSTPIQRKPKKGIKFWKNNPQPSVQPSASTSSPQSAVFWPYHLLKDVCPQARILTWGYDSAVSKFFGGPAGHNSILDYARELLGDLSGEREEYDDRPMIFVAHSLGGIIVKQTLLFSEDSNLLEWKSIFPSTKAVFFLGTPHSGSLFSDTGETLRMFAKAVGFDTARQNLEVLRIDSPMLELNRDQFFRLYDKYKSFEICTFQEGLGMTGIGVGALNKKVVENVLSEFPGSQKKFTIQGNHMTMCKYSGREDNGFLTISRELRRACKKAMPVSVVRGNRNGAPEAETVAQLKSEHLDSLLFPEMHDRERQVQEVRGSSCDWIFNDEGYLQWKRDKCGIFGIRGKPGTGKSTLLKKIYLSMDKEDAQIITLKFFFHRRGVLLQQTRIGMFRTLLYQLLKELPSVGSEFSATYEQKSRTQGTAGKDWQWKLEELAHMFSSALIKAAEERRIRIFVDALDEAQAEGDVVPGDIQKTPESRNTTAQVVADYLYEMNGKLCEQHAIASICFSCRHLPVVSVSSKEYEVIVEDYNYDDLSRYTRTELERRLRGFKSRPVPNKHLETLHHAVVERSSSIFIWVVFVIPHISRLYNNAEPLESVMKSLESIPTDLHQTYRQILQEVIEEERRPITIKLLEWIFLAERPLTVTEMRYALALDENFAGPKEVSCKTSNGFPDNDDEMEKYIHSTSGGLAEIKIHENYFEKSSTKIVQFIHQSVNDFLSHDRFKCIEPQSDLNRIGYGHHRLSRSCINYLYLIHIGIITRKITLPTPRSNVWEKISKKISEKFPFARYAVVKWFVHASKAEADGISQADLLQSFAWPSKEFFSSWVTLYSNYQEKTWESLHVYKGATLLHISAATSLQTTVQELVVQGFDINEKDEEGNTALHYTALAGLVGHEEMIELLMENGLDLQEKNNGGENLLYLACINENYSLGRTLLLQLNADPNVQGGYYGNALQAATYKGSKPIVKLLLNEGADVNAQGGNFGNALQAAIYKGSEPIVKLLIKEGADINAQSGFYGNALQAAAYRQGEPLVRLLVEKGADINAQGGDFGNALQAAACRGSEPIVRLLLKEGTDINIQGGYYGNALQAAAYRISEPIVRLLLKEGADINARGGYYWNALQAAVYGVSEPIVRLLLKEGADINAQGGYFGNTLSAAACVGNDNIVKLLLNNGAKVNIEGTKIEDQEKVKRIVSRIHKVAGTVREEGLAWK